MITNVKIREYMMEWMDLYGIRDFDRSKSVEYIYCKARNIDKIQHEYKIDKLPDSENQCNVYCRIAGTNDTWEWVDAISVEE